MILGFDQLKITMFWAHYPSFTSIQLAKTKVDLIFGQFRFPIVFIHNEIIHQLVFIVNEN